MGKTHRLLILIIMLAACSTAFSQGVVVNEVMSSNSSTISDMDGDFEDWIELYNPTPLAIDLTGWGLSDDPNNPFRWVFPSYNITPGEFLLVWASGKNRRPEQNGTINGLMREVWEGIPGGRISDLINHPNYPGSPTSRAIITDLFEAPTDVGDNYGQRIHGWIQPPATGNYTFWIAGDDESHLYLSTNQSTSNTELIARVPDWTSSREWDKDSEQMSAQIYLEEGKLYYVMALMKEAEGGDNLAVGWQLPNGTLQRPIPGDYLVWEDSELHTNFSIKASGEEVLLTNPSGQLISSIPAVPIPTDMSYGRYPNGSESLMYFNPATPGESNSNAGFTNVLSPPTLSHPSGTFFEPFLLSITHTQDDVNIYFTLDGTEPIPADNLIYTEPIAIEGLRRVNAIAASPTAITSRMSNAIFTQIDQSLSDFSSNLPLAIIHQIGQPFTDGNRTPGYMIMFEADTADQRVPLTIQPSNIGHIVGNIRGSSSQSFPKNMFGIHLLDDDGSNRSESLLGMPADHNWILYAPYSDKTLMRNVVSYQLSNDMGRWGPGTQFFELFLHQGDGPVTESHYHGVYVLTERIKWGDGRVEIEKLSPNDNQEPEITGGYIFKKDRLNPGESGLRTSRNTHLAYVRPNESEITSAQSQWLTGYLNRYEAALFGSNFTDPVLGYKPYIDVGSFIDYHLIIEACKEIDGFRLSTFMYKDRGGKLNMGPVWDYNLSLGNADYLEGWIPEGWYYPLISRAEYMDGWYTRLFQDPSFERQHNRRWWQLRRGPFSYQHIRGLVEHNASILDEAQRRNFERWNTLGSYVWPNAPGWGSRTSYRSEVDWMLNWISLRLEWIDDQMGHPAELIHYWHFNNLPEGTQSELIAPDYSVMEGASIAYEGSGNGYMDMVTDGTLLNSDLMQPAVNALRVRNPSDTRELVISIPTNGYRDIGVSYAVKRTSNGASSQSVYIRTSNGGPWSLLPSSIEIKETYQVYSFDLSGFEEANNNPELAFMVVFEGEQASGESGNNRFDNITVEGYYLELYNRASNDSIYAPECIYFNQTLYIKNFCNEVVDVQIYNLNGRLIVDTQIKGTGKHPIPFIHPKGMYIVRMVIQNEVYTERIIN